RAVGVPAQRGRAPLLRAARLRARAPDRRERERGAGAGRALRLATGALTSVTRAAAIAGAPSLPWIAMLGRLADLVVRAPRRVLAGALAFAVVAAAFGLEAPRLLGRGSNDFIATSSESAAVDRRIERATGLSSSPQVLVLV